MSWYNEFKKIKNFYLVNFLMGIVFWILISPYLWCDIWVKNLYEQTSCERESHITEFHALPHEISTFICILICERLRPRPVFIGMLSQTHVNGWSRVIASQNGGLTSYIFPFRLRVLQWSRHLFNYWNK